MRNPSVRTDRRTLTHRDRVISGTFRPPLARESLPDSPASLLASLLSKVTLQNSRASGVVAYEGAIGRVDRGASYALRHLELASPPMVRNLVEAPFLSFGGHRRAIASSVISLAKRVASADSSSAG